MTKADILRKYYDENPGKPPKLSLAKDMAGPTGNRSAPPKS